MARAKYFLFLFFLKALSLAVFLIILGAIGYFLLFSPGRKRLTSLTPSPPPSRAENLLIEQQIGLKFIEFRGDRGRIEIKAQRHLAMKEGQYRLEGDVLIHDFGRRQGPEAWISCQQAQYDQEWSQVILSGEVKMRRQGLELEAEKLFYYREAEFIEAQGEVKIKFKKISGQADKLVYFLKEEKLQLSQDVKIEVKTSDPPQAPLMMEGQFFTLARGKSWGRLEGQVRFRQGSNFGEANWIEFLLSEDEQYLRHLEMGDQIKGQIKIDSVDTLLKASSLKIRPFYNSNRIHALEAKGNCLMEIIRDKEKISFVGENLSVVFDRWGGLREIKSEDQASWLRKDLNSGVEQEARAELINFFAGKEHLLIKSPKEKKAYLSQPGAKISATEMTLNVGTQDLEAQQAVQFIISPEQKEFERRNWLLSTDKPIFGYSEIFYFSLEKNWLLLEKEARLWQESLSLQANQIILCPDSRELEATDQVKMIVVRREEKRFSQPQQVIMTSPKLKYWPAENCLIFEGPAEMKWADFQVKAQALEIDFKGESAEIEEVKTKGEVNVVKGMTKASAQRGYYDWEKDVLILEGRPVLEDPEKGVIRGDKLTFNLAEGRILVENQGRERSISIIKK
ncbi:MAG: LPS export ABC transporter periplasmic protein LptC [Candidatus Aminicenantes bacterium]|nr:LPS export ABC transporter periplasmic protein LptC [Candidatus Aminicenantes bacterium]